MTGRSFYYVVFVGRVPGIYDSWIACSKQVTCFPGNVYKKYPSFEAANNAWTTYRRPHSNVQLLSPQVPEFPIDYPPLLVPVHANMDDHTPSKHCVYIAMLVVGVVIGILLLVILMYIFF
ncbi:hypothetical protein RHMOL_Rhmol01G0124700 [Rhododendron molle]|uniref:Uncharacterized protein n=1 Tax=Rhododendron molle TaxID=49168 RepID=A0ACC0Q0F3_RHOML|nr:hypothetical protein RHMOL_Rhmol01G0124700 [Rhododendron molle]